MTLSSTTWKHSRTVIDSEPFYINGTNIWDKEWRNTGASIQIKDPLYQQEYQFNIYEITAGTQTIRFAAGEFSNCVWGIYEPVT